MAFRARIALLALLIAGAVVAMPAIPADQAVSQPAEPGDANSAVAVLMLIVVPALALVIFAMLRYRPPRRPSMLRDERKRPSWRGAVIALVALMTLAVVMAILPRTGTREPADGSRIGNGDRSPTDREPPASAPPPAEGQGLDIELWSLFVLATMLLLLTLGSAARRKHRVDDPAPDADQPGPTRQQERLAVAVNRALSAVDDAAASPRDSIIRCYAAMERALIDTPGAEPEPADTPSDVLGRAAEHGHIRPESGRLLVDLFTEARYSSHAMTEDDVTTAAKALRTILDDLRRHAWVRS